MRLPSRIGEWECRWVWLCNHRRRARIAAAGERMNGPVRHIILISALGASCLLATSGMAAGGYSQVDAEKLIKAGEAAWAEFGLRLNDSSVLQRIMADDAVWVLDGEVWTKARAVADAAAGPGDYPVRPSEFCPRSLLRRYGRSSRRRDVDPQGRSDWTVRVDRHLGASERKMADCPGARRHD